MKGEKLSEQEVVVLKRLAQVTYEATIEAVKKIDEYKKHKSALKKSR